jgi:hypothetical protein
MCCNKYRLKQCPARDLFVRMDSQQSADATMVAELTGRQQPEDTTVVVVRTSLGWPSTLKCDGLIVTPLCGGRL